MRRNRAEKRDVIPDPRFQSEVLAKFINNVMERGKKSVAAAIVYDAFALIEERAKRPGAAMIHDERSAGLSAQQLDLVGQAKAAAMLTCAA